MKTLALLARKGGAGKTTLAVHLAVVAQQAGLRVLLVDCDPQKSAGDWWRSREAQAPELMELPLSRLPDVLTASRREGVDLVVVDTRPSVETDTVRAAGLADLVVIPTRPAILDLRAVAATLGVMRSTRAPGLIVLNGCPAPRGTSEASLTMEARRALAGSGVPVSPVSIALRADLSHALVDGRAVTEFAPDGKAAGELRALWGYVREQLT